MTCKPRTVMLADNSSVTASKCRRVLLQFENAKMRLKEVIFNPILGCNLLSTGRHADKDNEFHFLRNDVVLKLQGT